MSSKIMLFPVLPLSEIIFMRGQKIFDDIIKDTGLSGNTRKGRSNSLITKRNECLAARFYYYGSMKHKCYEEILRLLLSEFFIAPDTISSIIQDSLEQLRLLKKKNPTLYYFQRRWSHLKWA
jgi:hypothetical protein